MDEEALFEAEFEQRFETALRSGAPDSTRRPNISDSAMACAFIDADHRFAWTDLRFDHWIGLNQVDFDLCDKVRFLGEDEVVLTYDRLDRPMLLIYAPATMARNWPVPSAFYDAVRNADQLIAVGALSLAHLSDDLIHAATALGMTNLEARVASALVAHGSMRRAAAHCGITYNTARKSTADAMRKLHVSSQTKLVRKLSEIATSLSPPKEEAERLLVDSFGLSLREAELTLLIAQGFKRGQAAEAAGISKAVAKDVFSSIFDKLGIDKAPEIPRIVMDVFMVALLGNEQKSFVANQPNDRQPLQLIKRPDGTFVGCSDFGPRAGRPVLIMHSSLSTRHPFHRLVSTLQGRGFRPFSIDRPGFGMSDNAPEATDAFATGMDDIPMVFDALGIEQADLITRGGAFAALALQRSFPQLIRQAVIINPDLLHEQCSTRKGNLGIVRAAFDRFPNRVESIVQWACAQLTPERTSKFISMAVKNCPVDTRSFRDPKNLADYRRSILVFATGRLSGFIREQKAYVGQKVVEPSGAATNWTILLGDDDPIHDVAEIERHWKVLLPGAAIRRISGAERFMELSHVEAVVDALLRKAKISDDAV